jgi:rfaE bifunctional protein nucleotidyltransferase chain/domain
LGKVISQDELMRLRRDWKREGRKIVCASGGFDLLHPGHIRLLEQARSLGDILVVAVESDRSVGGRTPSAVGVARPITPAAERAEILAALAAVDYAAEFDDVSPRGLLAHLQPDVFVAGGSAGDPAARQEDEALGAAGCRVVRLALEPGYSTALLIERIQQLPA